MYTAIRVFLFAVLVMPAKALIRVLFELYQD